MKRLADGFTLLEVLVALFITSVALAAGMRALGGVTRVSQDLAPRLLAQWSADNQLAQLRLDRTWPGMGETTSDCPQGAYHFVCHVTVSPTPNPFFRQVVVTVTASGETSVLATAISVLANEQAHVL